MLKSILYLGLLVGVLAAPTQQDDPKQEIGFVITETYNGKTDTKDLWCSEDTSRGSHPHPQEACDDVRGIFNGKDPSPPDDCMCDTQSDPIDFTLTVTLPYSDTPYTNTVQFANPCMYYCQTSAVPHLVDIGVVPPKPT